MSNGWNRDLLDAIDACIVSAGGTPGARVGNWNQDVLAALTELSTAIGSGGGGGGGGSGAALMVTRPGTSGAGSTTSVATAASGARAMSVTVSVDTAFDGGATGKVGFSDDDDALLTVSDLDASVLSATGLYHFVVDVPVSGTRALVVSTTGSSTQGSMRVIAQFVNPET